MNKKQSVIFPRMGGATADVGDILAESPPAFWRENKIRDRMNAIALVGLDVPQAA